MKQYTNSNFVVDARNGYVDERIHEIFCCEKSRKLFRGNWIYMKVIKNYNVIYDTVMNLCNESSGNIQIKDRQ